jgi:hypothetical protein
MEQDTEEGEDMKTAARIVMAVVIGITFAASAASAADFKFSGFFGDPASMIC